VPRGAPETRQDANPADKKKTKVFDIERISNRGCYNDSWEEFAFENE